MRKVVLSKEVFSRVDLAQKIKLTAKHLMNRRWGDALMELAAFEDSKEVLASHMIFFAVDKAVNALNSKVFANELNYDSSSSNQLFVRLGRDFVSTIDFGHDYIDKDFFENPQDWQVLDRYQQRGTELIVELLSPEMRFLKLYESFKREFAIAVTERLSRFLCLSTRDPSIS